MRLRARFESNGDGSPAPMAAAKKVSEDQTRAAPSAAARNLALAHHVERLIDRGLITDYTQAAQMLGVSQPRMTHLMGLLLLAPAIQEAILVGEVAPRDKELRQLSKVAHWHTQEERVSEREEHARPMTYART